MLQRRTKTRLGIFFQTLLVENHRSSEPSKECHFQLFLSESKFEARLRGNINCHVCLEVPNERCSFRHRVADNVTKKRSSRVLCVSENKRMQGRNNGTIENVKEEKHLGESKNCPEIPHENCCPLAVYPAMPIWLLWVAVVLFFKCVKMVSFARSSQNNLRFPH